MFPWNLKGMDERLGSETVGSRSVRRSPGVENPGKRAELEVQVETKVYDSWSVLVHKRKSGLIKQAGTIQKSHNK